MVLASIGGIFGTVLGYLLIAVRQGARLERRRRRPNVALALGTSTSIGLLFGFLPARRARKLDPIKTSVGVIRYFLQSRSAKVPKLASLVTCSRYSL